jgi:hypothetical protein
MRELVHVSPADVLWKAGPDDDRWFVQVERVPDDANAYSVAIRPDRSGSSVVLIVVVEDGRPCVGPYIEPYTPAARLSHADCEAQAKDAVMEVIKNRWL